MPLYALVYDTVPDYVARRQQFRVEHLALAERAHREGRLLLAGALYSARRGAAPVPRRWPRRRRGIRAGRPVREEWLPRHLVARAGVEGGRGRTRVIGPKTPRPRSRRAWTPRRGPHPRMLRPLRGPRYAPRVTPSVRALSLLALATASARGAGTGGHPPGGPPRFPLPAPRANRARSARSSRCSSARPRAFAVEVQALPSGPTSRISSSSPRSAPEARDVDVFALDVVRVAEPARAGWLADVSAAFPPARVRAESRRPPRRGDPQRARRSPCPGTSTSGLLYYRRDSSREPPRTYAALRRRLGAAPQPRRPGSRVRLAGAPVRGALPVTSSRRSGDTAALPPRASRLAGRHPRRRAPRSGWLRALVAGALAALGRAAAEEDAGGRSRRGRGRLHAQLAVCVGRSCRTPPRRYAEGRSLRRSRRERLGRAGRARRLAARIPAGAPPARRAAAARLVAHLTLPPRTPSLAIPYGWNPARRPRTRTARPPECAVHRGAPSARRAGALRVQSRPTNMPPADALQGEPPRRWSGLRSPAEALGRAQAQADW